MANLWQAVSAASNRAAGSVGRAIDVVGRKAQAVGINLPEKKISENLEQRGASGLTTQQRIAEQLSQNKPLPVGDLTSAIKMGVDPNQIKTVGISNQGITPTSSAQSKINSGTPGLAGDKQFTSNETAALGIDPGQLWGGNEVTINGQRYRVRDNGNGTRSFEAISGGSGGGNIDVSGAFRSAGGGKAMDFLSQSDVDSILSRYASGAYGRADELAAEIERVATENANREYSDVMDALRGQKEEVSRLGTQQRDRALKQKELTEQELADTSNTELRNIDKQRSGFIEENEDQVDRLGRAWRDMSLEVQRIMRGKGTSDSSYAAGEEVSVLKDFNQGLRKLSLEKSGALRDFSDAVIETVNFYQRKKVQLQEEVRVALEDIDNWVRQQTTSIQNQERVAVSKKLADINNALLQARQLKFNIANQVAQTELNFGMWLEQTKINYQMAVATAAKGKVQDAQSKIAEAAALSKNMATLLENGQAQWIQDGSGAVTGIQDALTGAIIPVRPGFKDEYDTQKNLELQKNTISATPSLEEQINSLIRLPGSLGAPASGVAGAIQSTQRR